MSTYQKRIIPIKNGNLGVPVLVYEDQNILASVAVVVELVLAASFVPGGVFAPFAEWLLAASAGGKLLVRSVGMLVDSWEHIVEGVVAGVAVEWVGMRHSLVTITVGKVRISD